MKEKVNFKKASKGVWEIQRQLPGGGDM